MAEDLTAETIKKARNEMIEGTHYIKPNSAQFILKTNYTYAYKEKHRARGGLWLVWEYVTFPFVWLKQKRAERAADRLIREALEMHQQQLEEEAFNMLKGE